MKIVHVYYYYGEGLGFEENYLPAAQVRLSEESVVITRQLGRKSRERLGVTQKTTDKSVEICRLPTYFLVASHSQTVLRGLGRVLRQYSPDIVHIHGATGALPVQALWHTRRMGVPTVVDLHISHDHLLPISRSKRMYYWIFRRLIYALLGRHVRGWLPITPGAERVLVKRLGRDSADIHHMSLGAGATISTSDEEVTELRNRAGVPSGAVVAAYAGQMHPGKRVDRLLWVLGPQLVVENWFVVLIGRIKPELQESLMHLVPAEARDRVLFTGSLDQEALAMWLASADIGIWPGAYGITILQGMAAGLPIVIKDDAATRHYVDGNGYVFETDEELGTILTELRSDMGLRETMSARSRERAIQAFNWDSLARRSITIYKAAIRGSPPDIPPLW